MDSMSASELFTCKETPRVNDSYCPLRQPSLVRLIYAVHMHACIFVCEKLCC